MDYRCKISQNVLKWTYEHALLRMKAHPNYAEKNKDIIQKCPFFKSEEKALQNALDMMKKEFSFYHIWAKVEKTGDLFRIKDCWIVTDNNKVKMAAEYIGFALIYDETRLQKILANNINIDDIVALYK